MTRLDDLEQMHRVPSWIELAIISDAVHDREGAERAADELAELQSSLDKANTAINDWSDGAKKLFSENTRLKAEFKMLIDHHQKHHQEGDK